jgi:photosystem II stability/assembly factor-like uncharacterized protein
VTVPALGPVTTVSAAFAGDRRVLATGARGSCPSGPAQPATPVVSSANGGRTWYREGTVPLAGPGSVSFTGRRALVVDECTGTFATSEDGGRHWQRWAYPRGLEGGFFATSGSVAGPTMVVADAAPGRGPRLLVSRDGGRLWTAYRLSGPQAAELTTVVAAGPGDLWAAGPDDALWHSNDGGARWHLLRLALPVAS